MRGPQEQSLQPLQTKEKGVPENVGHKIKDLLRSGQVGLQETSEIGGVGARDMTLLLHSLLKHGVLCSGSRTDGKNPPVRVCACDSSAGEVELSGSLRLAGFPAWPTQ